MTTYVDGKPMRYPRTGDWVRRNLEPPLWEKGLIVGTTEDGTVTVCYDEGDDVLYEPDQLELHASGWYWLETEQEEVGW